MLHVRSYSVRNKKRNRETVSSFRRNRERRKLGITLSNTSTVSGVSGTESASITADGKKSSIDSTTASEKFEVKKITHKQLQRTASEHSQYVSCPPSPSDRAEFITAVGLQESKSEAVFELCMKSLPSEDKATPPTCYNDTPTSELLALDKSPTDRTSLRPSRVTFNCSPTPPHTKWWVVCVCLSVCVLVSPLSVCAINYTYFGLYGYNLFLILSNL